MLQHCSSCWESTSYTKHITKCQLFRQLECHLLIWRLKRNSGLMIVIIKQRINIDSMCANVRDSRVSSWLYFSFYIRWSIILSIYWKHQVNLHDFRFICDSFSQQKIFDLQSLNQATQLLYLRILSHCVHFILEAIHKSRER